MNYYAVVTLIYGGYYLHSFLTFTRIYGCLKVLHFCLVRNYGLRVCGLVFTSLEARLVFCKTRKLELLSPDWSCFYFSKMYFFKVIENSFSEFEKESWVITSLKTSLDVTVVLRGKIFSELQ